jgi:hypothetical protein
MVVSDSIVDAVVIGGGFYGSVIAIYLAKQRGLKVVLIERESELFSRASYNNQARIHNGYHYPRSLTTAYRSHINFPRFVTDWPEAIKKNFTKLYAIARRNSKITAKQFLKFCKEIGAKIEPADKSLRQLFETQLIEEIFMVEEYAYDSTNLASWVISELEECGVIVKLSTRATSISSTKKRLSVNILGDNDTTSEIISRYVFNCAYSGLNQMGGDFPSISIPLKQEITELVLMDVPPKLKGLGITLMDGPFFSLMPFPPRGLHTLSHVRYTPHMQWNDSCGVDPYKKLDAYNQATRVDRMVRDTARYLPAILDAQHVDSLFEVKTVLVKNECDDGRPILFEKHVKLPGCYSILGGKIDNIYDVLEKLDKELLVR